MGLTAHCVYVSRASLALQSDHILLLLLLFYSLLGFTKVTRHILFAFFYVLHTQQQKVKRRVGQVYKGLD